MPPPDPARQSAGWMSRGACLREDPELTFPVSETHAAAGRQITAAKAVCGRCLVRVMCLACALATGQDGVWGDDRLRASRLALRRPPGGCAGSGSGRAGRRTAGGFPYGAWLLALLAVGLFCCGLYCLAEARYRDLTPGQ
jgi:WhiB family transcriptional regulator, redox-sensing transcriptional regulator